MDGASDEFRQSYRLNAAAIRGLQAALKARAELEYAEAAYSGKEPKASKAEMSELTKGNADNILLDALCIYIHQCYERAELINELAAMERDGTCYVSE